MTPTDDRPRQDIAEAIERLCGAVAGRAGFGHSASTSVSTLGPGLACRSTERGHHVNAGLPAAFGGDGTAPTPTALLRAALGACLAMGYRLHAAELGVELSFVRVTVDSESELSGMLDPDSGQPPGFTALSYRVEIDSSSPAGDVERLVELADRLSPVLDALSSPHTLSRSMSITGSGG